MFYISSILKIFFIFAAFTTITYGQTNTLNDNWRWVHFTTDDGLPSNRVFDIIETKNGIVWAATEFGTAWYNGFYWQSISHKYGLPERMPQAIVSDESDSIYLLISFQLYYGGQKGFRKIPIIIHGEEQKVNSIALFSNNELLMTVNEKLFILQANSIKPFILSSENIENQKILKVLRTRYSSWLNTAGGLYRWEKNQWTLKIKSASLPIGVELLVEDSLGNGLASILSPRSHFGLWEWTTNSEPRRNQNEGIENVLALDIGSTGDAIMIKDPDVVKIRHNSVWSPLQYVPFQLKDAHILKYRTKGDLWVGTELGLYLHRAASKRWEVWKFTQFDLKNNINEIIRTKDGSIWLATGNGLVTRKPNGTTQTIEKIFNTKLTVLTGLIEDDEGNVWISSGLSFEGAFRWDGRRWKYFGLKEGLDAGHIHKIKKDIKGRLWFLGIFKKDPDYRNIDKEPGAYVYDNGKFIYWGTEKGLIDGRVYSFAEGLDGSFWFATAGGISSWRPESSNSSAGTWKHWTEKEGLRDTRIFTLAIDNQNKVWFSDRGYGLGFIEDDTVKFLTTSDGLVSNAIWDIRIDEKNRLWIAGRGGINLFDNGTWFNIDLNDGLSNAHIWPLLPLENKLFLGTGGGGVEILNLEDIQTTPPIVDILEPVTRGNTLYAHCKVFSYWGEQVSADIEIRYKIDDKEWTSWSRQRQIIEPNLSSGSHTLTVQTKGLLGNYRTDIKSTAFKIEPPLFLKPMFYFPVGTLSIGLLMFGFIYFKKKREQAIILKKSEYRYRNLFENANDAIMIFDPKQEIILEVNKKACELYGYLREEFIGKSLKNISKNVELGEIAIEQTLRERKKETVETIHFTKDGDELHIIASAVVIDYEGRDAILSINRDVTELRQAEAKQRLLAQTVASTKDAICITDLNNNFLFVNDAFIEMYGYSEEELNGKNISLIVSPDVTEEIQREIHKTTIGKGDWNGEVMNRRKDGTSFPVELWSSVVFDMDDKPVALVGVARDIAERKQAELALREINRNQEIIFKSVPVALYRAIPGSDFDATWISDNIFQITGFKPDQFLKEKSFWKSRIHETDLGKVTNDFYKIETEGQITTEYRWRISDGTYRWFLDQAVLIHENEKNVKMMYGAWIDITERKLFEEEREKLIQELKEALAEVKNLSGLLPICSSCKKIRDDKGYWGEVESYIMKHTDATFTHGLCPECIIKYFPQISKKTDSR